MALWLAGEGGGEGRFGGVFVEVKEMVSAFEEFGGRFAGLVIDPIRRVRHRLFIARRTNLESTDAVEDQFDFAECTFGKDQEEVATRKSYGKVGAPNGFFHPAREIFHKGVDGRLAVLFGKGVELIDLNGGEAEGGVFAARTADLFAELGLDGSASV